MGVEASRFFVGSLYGIVVGFAPREIPFDFAQGRLSPRLNCTGFRDDAIFRNE
jgi:hypothetical protein